MTMVWKYLLFFLLCLLISLVVNLPVRQVLSHIEIPKTVRLAGVDGTVIVGRVGKISVNEFPFRAVNYHLEPGCLLLLKICYRLDYERGSTRAAFNLLSSDIEVAQARADYPASELAVYVPNQMIQPEGLLELNVEELVIVAGKLAKMTGKLIWRDLGVKSGETALNIGDYQIDFSGNPQQYDFKLNDLKANLDVSGKGEISVDGQYSVDIRIVSEATIDPKLKNVLDLFANPISYNNYRVEQSGRLPANVTRLLFK